MTDIAKLEADLIRDEAFRGKPFTDTAGKLTVGYGRNLADVGISPAEALMLLRNDMATAELELDRGLPWWRGLSEPRQRALANMCFNLGLRRLMGFHRMLAALQARDYTLAAKEALDSKWADQVGNRAKRIAALIEEG